MKIKELFENVIRWEKFRQGPDYRCTDNKLTSLEGAPQNVEGGFYCDGNNLTSLRGGPQKVGSNFTCGRNKLTSLEGGPQSIGGGFLCSYNELTSLEGAPREIVGICYCNNNKLTSLEGAPLKIGDQFYCYNNPIKSLKGIGKDYLKEIYGSIDLSECPIESHMLGLLKVKGLTFIRFNHNHKVEAIINKHLKSRDLLSCQEELIENGLEQYAQL